MDKFPYLFEQQIRHQFGAAEWEGLEAALRLPAPVSIRHNAHRRPDDHTLLPISDGAIPWHPEGHYLAERPIFTLDPLFHAGAYYVQEASSMFVYEVLKQTGMLGKTWKVLDLCAAPGGKTTLIYDATNALLTASEIISNRASILRENLEKWGVSDAAVVCADPANFEQLPDWFDLILVDAPCSGEGLFRKDPDAIREWSPDSVQACAIRQSHILEVAKKALAPGGLIIYSTCTYNNTENEAQVTTRFPLDEYKVVELDLPASWGVLKADIGYRMMPHRVKGEGFYIAAFEKRDTGNSSSMPKHSNGFRQLTPLHKKFHPILHPWLSDPESLRFWQTPSGGVLALPAERESELMVLDPYFQRKWFGCLVGALKGNDLIPAHALATSSIVHSGLNRLAVTRNQALTYLKKETFDLPPGTALGWTLVTYSGLVLGWIKVLPNRMNNYLPQERRIRMEVR